MANRKISQFSNLAGAHTPTMTIPVVNPAAGSTAAGNRKTTINDLFADLGLNTTDKGVSMTGVATASAPAVSAAGKSKTYFDQTISAQMMSFNEAPWRQITSKPNFTIATLPTPSSEWEGVTVSVSDGNRGQLICRNTIGGIYAWIDNDPVVRPEKFGWSSSATAANNAIYLQAAVDAAIAAGIGIVEFPSGTFEWSTSITLSASNITFQGQGQATVLRFSGSGPTFRNSDWTAVKNFINYKDFWLYAYGSAINSATSIGIDMSSTTDSQVDNVYLYNFGTGILLDGHRPATATAYSTYYNKIINCFVGASSDGYTNCVRGVSILNGANSNTIDNLKTSRYTNPISLGDGSYEAPNQIEIKNPIIEAHLGAGINIVKGYGIVIRGGRFEGAHTAIKVTDALADTVGITIDSPYFQISGNRQVLDTKNPTVVLRGGNLSNMRFQHAGLGANGYNLIQNANLEGWGNSGTTKLLGWFNVAGTTWTAATANSSRISTPIKSGTYAVQIASSVGAGQAAQIFPVVEGKPYSFSYYSASNSTTNGHRFMIRWFDSAGAQITSGWSDPNYYGLGDNYEGGISGLSYSGTWNAWLTGSDFTHAVINTYTRRAGMFTPPTGAVSGQFAVVVLVTGGGVLYVDEFQFVAGAVNWQAQDAPLPSGGGTVYGNLSAPQLVVADISTGTGSLTISTQGNESRIRETGAARIYYDAYNHVWRDYSGSTYYGRWDQNGNFLLGGTFLSEDIGIRRNAAGVLEINSGTVGTFRDLKLRNLELANGDFITGTGTGTKFGTTTTQKLGFWNTTPIIQPSSTGETAGFVAGIGTSLMDGSTFTGNVGSTAYRISDIVKHLKTIGLLAQ